MFFAMVILAAVCFFAILNSAQKINITVWPGREYFDVPLVVALFSSFVLGALIVFIFSLFRDMMARANLSRIRRENARLADELTALRNLPLEEPAGGREAELADDTTGV
jgi:uncharacterized integral membrane protein